MNNTEFLAWLAANKACRDAVKWVADRDLATSWAECVRVDWMLWLAAKAGVDRKVLVLAACECAEPALVHLPAGEDRPRIAIETARAWTRGAATLQQVRDDASYADRAASTSSYAASAAASSAAAASASASAEAAEAASFASYAAASAAEAYAASASAEAAEAASDDAYAFAKATSLKHSADLVRERISAQMIEDAINATKES